MSLSGDFKCDKCEKAFSKENNLRRHQLLVHHSKKQKCPECDVILSSDRNMQRHLLLHRGAKAYACSICGEEFYRREQVERHLNSQHNVSRIECKLCGKGFGSKYAAVEHLKNSHNYDTDKKEDQSSHSDFDGRAIKCLACRKNFHTEYHMERHMRLHHGAVKKIAIVKPAVMDKSKLPGKVPSKMVSSTPKMSGKLNLKKQPNVKSVKPNPIRNKTISPKRKQLKTTPGVKNKKETLKSESLKKALNLSSSKIPVACMHCDRVLSSSYSLERHIAAIHAKDLQQNSVFKCKKCSKQFTQAIFRDKHMFAAHKPNQYSAGVLKGTVKKASVSAKIVNKSKKIAQQAGTKKKSMLVKGNVVQNFADRFCKLCKQTFASTYNLSRHLRNIHKKDV